MGWLQRRIIQFNAISKRCQMKTLLYMQWARVIWFNIEFKWSRHFDSDQPQTNARMDFSGPTHVWHWAGETKSHWTIKF